MPSHHTVRCASTAGRATAFQSSRADEALRTVARGTLTLHLHAHRGMRAGRLSVACKLPHAAYCCESLRGVVCRAVCAGSLDADKRVGQAWVEGQTQLAGKAVRISVQLSLGGAAFGVAVGVIVTSWLRTMFDNRMAEITLTVRFLLQYKTKVEIHVLQTALSPGFNGCVFRRPQAAPRGLSACLWPFMRPALLYKTCELGLLQGSGLDGESEQIENDAPESWQRIPNSGGLHWKNVKKGSSPT